jgi:hypothetical protein
VTELLEQAFRALAGAEASETPIVVDTLVASGDEETFALCEKATGDSATFKALAAKATELGSNPFDCLDLVYGVAGALADDDR